MLLAFATIVTLLIVIAAARRRRAIAAAPSPAAADLVRRLRALKREDRLGAFGSSIIVPPDTWEGSLALGLRRAPDDRERIDVASEAVSALEERYSAGAAWSGSAVRIVLLFGLLLGTIGIATSIYLQAVLAFVVAGVGASVTHGLVASAASCERRQRETADDLVELMVLGERPPGRRGRRS